MALKISMMTRHTLLQKKIWFDVIEENDSSESAASLSFVKYLEIIHQRAMVFSYDIARDDSGTLVGAVQMTGTMRQNFELFGS